MFDTRAGFWLLASIGVLSVVATVAAVALAPRDTLGYETIASALGFPSTLILPLIAILAVTGEWSQRSGLTTFTLVPRRGRVIGAKAVATAVVGVASVLAAFAIGAVGNLVGSAVVGVDAVWDIGPAQAAQIVLGNLVGMAIGFTLGVVLRRLVGRRRRLLRAVLRAVRHPAPARPGAGGLHRPAALGRLEPDPGRPVRGTHLLGRGVGAGSGRPRRSGSSYRSRSAWCCCAAPRSGSHRTAFSGRARDQSRRQRTGKARHAARGPVGLSVRISAMPCR
ncbi:hypothetical protein [Nocardioides convexus]|uniref:hypothetical protein n=1 Tax=Nocardioides convexus TaxID=2712224 RepID=UPI0024182B11|nr:hypothetical protein [Nocardioides convexus]